MEQHPNARLTPRGRETLVSRIESGLGDAEAARQMGVSRQTASKWLRRSRSGEPMSDRSSRLIRLARSTPHEVEDRVCEARSSMLPARTCARIVARRGMPRLGGVDRVTGEVRRRGPVTPVRYKRERPGELVHVDVKKVARIPDGGGWRARWGSVLARPDSGAGYAGLGLTVERVMTDNGPGGRSGEFNELLAAAGVRHVYTRPYRPWQNDRVEHFQCKQPIGTQQLAQFYIRLTIYHFH